MKQTKLILLCGLALALLAYVFIYRATTAQGRGIMSSPVPELAWLKTEFHLSDGEFKRVAQLHEAYRPHCKEMCRRIDAKNAEIKTLLEQTGAFTPEIEQKLNEAAQLRVACQKMMLLHFLEVSKTMPAQQGGRYLAWVQQRTFLPAGQMENPQAAHHD